MISSWMTSGLRQRCSRSRTAERRPPPATRFGPNSLSLFAAFSHVRPPPAAPRGAELCQELGLGQGVKGRVERRLLLGRGLGFSSHPTLRSLIPRAEQAGMWWFRKNLHGGAVAN